MEGDCTQLVPLYWKQEALRQAYIRTGNKAVYYEWFLIRNEYMSLRRDCVDQVSDLPPEAPEEPIEGEGEPNMDEKQGCDTHDIGSLHMSNRKLVFDQTVQHMDDLNKRALQFLDDAHAFSVKALTDAQSVANRVANDGATASNRANADAQTESHLISMKSIDNTLTWSNELASVTGSNAGTSQGRQNVNADAVQSQMASLVAAIIPIVIEELRAKKSE